MNSNSENKEDPYTTDKVATERDPLLLSSQPGYNSGSNIRERRTSSNTTSSTSHSQPYQNFNSSIAMRSATSQSSEGGASLRLPSRSYDHESVTSGGNSSYEILNESNNNISSRPIRSMRSMRSMRSSRGSRTFSESRHYGRADKLHDYYNERAKSIFSEQNSREELLIEVGPEILAVRKRALKVYEPMTYTWLFFVVGFSIGSAVAMARWTGLLPQVTYWFVLLPCWLSHIGLFVSHLYSAKALFTFISDANNNRQRTDTTDNNDRTEYLPLLQRALKFGLKTGAISFILFVFEVLLYVRLAFGTISLSVVLIPLWIIVGFGIIDGIICKTQHVSRVLSWLLILSSMILLVLRVDYGYEELFRWTMVLVPLVALLTIISVSLVYIIYGHQVGYYRLTVSQLNAGILYFLGSLGAALLFVTFSIMHMARPNVFEMRVVMVALAPLSVALVGLGAWGITRDEYERLLQYGGQQSVQPMKLRLEKTGWTAVEGKGATVIPMFGEVRYEPLDPSMKAKIVEMCMCCACYPYDDEEEIYTLPPNSDYPTISEPMTGLRIPSSTLG